MSQTNQSHKITLPDGACLQVFEQGAGTPLLLISGLGGAAAFWNPCLPARLCAFLREKFSKVSALVYLLGKTVS